jgi:hypothetical protein
MGEAEEMLALDGVLMILGEAVVATQGAEETVI